MQLPWKISLFLTAAIALSFNHPTFAKSSAPPAPANEPTNQDSEGCNKPILDNLIQHKVKQGETLEAIAKQYSLKTATLMALNEEVRNGEVTIGQSLAIPPLDGLTYRFKNEENYTTVAKKYNIAADLLFDRNGCQPNLRVVFVPGAIWRPEALPFKMPAIASRNFDNPAIIMQTGGYPLPYSVSVTSNYGWRMNPVTTIWSFHSGIDLGAPFGTPVLAAKSGRVEFAGWGDGYGNLVELDHGSTGTRYAHLEAIYVYQGQNVAQGQQIGLVGSTGRSTGPHLHFEIMVPTGDGWVALDPAPYLNRIAGIMTNLFLL